MSLFYDILKRKLSKQLSILIVMVIISHILIPLLYPYNYKQNSKRSLLSRLITWILYIICSPCYLSVCSTFFCGDASSMGQHSWTLCCFDVWHTRQMGCSSFWQKIFSFSLWRRQTSWFLPVLCTWYSAAIFSAKLIGGLSGIETVRHTGHSRQLLHSQNFCKHTLQILCPHCKTTGRQ